MAVIDEQTAPGCAYRARGCVVNEETSCRMVEFAIIELEDGLTLVELQRSQSPDDAAASRGGILIDPGPYSSFEEASDALDDLQYEDEEVRGEETRA
ncbi:MAG: hypothetical protein WD738_01685 [Pirellulales bacterium]